MSFFEGIAAALDAEGIESRVGGDVLFIPITSDVEIQFVEIDPLLPAANVYIAAADVDEDDDDFESALVSVVFSVEGAVAEVNGHIAVDQVITVLRDLLEGTDERIGDLEFLQDYVNPNLVRADVGAHSELRVLVEVVEGMPTATVQFVATGDDYENVVDQVIDELWESDGDAELSDEDRRRLFSDITADPSELPAEVLDLGSFTDFDRLFDVLSLADDQAENWEEQLFPFDEKEYDLPEVYDIYGEDLDAELDDELEDDLDDLDDLDDDELDDELDDEDLDDVDEDDN